MSISEEEAIEFVRDKIAHLQRHIESYEKSKCKTAVYQSLVKEKESLEILIETLEKKDKIIEEMAKNIASSDSDLCQYIDETTRCKKYAGENRLTCDECIKQYFEKKVDGNDINVGSIMKL